MDALKRAKCARVYQEKASGMEAERPELMKLLDNACKGDVVIVWKLDRLGRSLRQLIDTTVLLNERGVDPRQRPCIAAGLAQASQNVAEAPSRKAGLRIALSQRLST